MINYDELWQITTTSHFVCCNVTLWLFISHYDMGGPNDFFDVKMIRFNAGIIKESIIASAARQSKTKLEVLS
jgi:hypothetical protein